MQVELVYVTAEGKQSPVPLKKPVYVIGRHTDCSIRLPAAGVSRHHCEISLGEDKVSVRDLGSSNGTFVNRRRVSQADLAAGDSLSVGEHVFVVRVNGKPEDIDPEEAYDEGVVLTAAIAKAAAPEARTAVSRPAAEHPASPPVKPDAPPQKKSLMEDSDFDDLVDSAGKDDSSVLDFDFLDDDDDAKKQPKL
jgi:pSer/pThr/pTyr-binding forkhead associated (FHA) protein